MRGLARLLPPAGWAMVLAAMTLTGMGLLGIYAGEAEALAVVRPVELCHHATGKLRVFVSQHLMDALRPRISRLRGQCSLLCRGGKMIWRNLMMGEGRMHIAPAGSESQLNAGTGNTSDHVSGTYYFLCLNIKAPI